MSATMDWPWAAVLALGVWHGINPAMGWLFAVALGLQEQKRRAVWRALLPLALGHGLAIGGAIALAILLGLVFPLQYLKWVVAAALLGFGIYRLARNRHPNWGGMKVGLWDLTVWSFLMASAHGAGLMVLPFVIGNGGAPMTHAHDASMAASHSAHAAHFAASVWGPSDGQLMGLLATGVHTFGYLAITGLVAVVVFEKLGLRLLRNVWINLDLIWGVVLIGTAILTPLI
jgi:hypothetical protein